MLIFSLNRCTRRRLVITVTGDELVGISFTHLFCFPRCFGTFGVMGYEEGFRYAWSAFGKYAEEITCDSQVS